MNQQELLQAHKLQNFIKGHKNVDAVWLDEKGDYHLSEVKGATTKVTREEILAVEIPALEVAPVEGVSEEQQLTNTALVDENNSLKAKINENGIKLAEFEKQVGEIDKEADEVEEDKIPRAATWLEERRNWMSQLKTTQEYAAELAETNKTQAAEIEDLKKKLADAQRDQI